MASLRRAATKESINMRITKLVVAIFVLLTTSCMSMTPTQFLDSFPTATNSYFYDPSDTTVDCVAMVKGRKYVAPIGMFIFDDVRYGARGVDEWVQADHGNAYSINNYEWKTVHDGATQLIIYFDTLWCTDTREPGQRL